MQCAHPWARSSAQACTNLFSKRRCLYIDLITWPCWTDQGAGYRTLQWLYAATTSGKGTDHEAKELHVYSACGDVHICVEHAC